LKILLLDVETAPNLAHVWGLWNQNVGLPQLIESGYTLCWAAKWLGEKQVHFASIRAGKKRMAREIHRLMQEADAIIHYNGNKFDVPTLNRDFLLCGLPPPSPSKQIDLLTTVRRKFRFPSNKLAYVSNALGIGSKLKHSGHELWVSCMAGDDAAWKTMEKYNVQDVRLLEALYDKLKPWIRSHPNHGLYNPDNSQVCPKCGSENHQRRGFEHTATCSYQRFQCCSCGGWFRGARNVGPKPSQKFANL
jgi:hypothetical protein